MITLQLSVYNFQVIAVQRLKTDESYKLNKQVDENQKLLNTPGGLLNGVVDNLGPLQTIAVVFGVNALNEARIDGCKDFVSIFHLQKAPSRILKKT